MHNFLARAFLRMFRPRMQQMDALLEQAPAFAQIGWRFRFEDQLNLLREIIDTFPLQRHRHAALRSHGVDGDGELAMSCRRRPASRKATLCLRRAISFRDLPIR